MIRFILLLGATTSQAKHCQENLCFNSNTLAAFSNIPNSIDFREKGLIGKSKNMYDCNASHIFSSIAMLENSMLLDQKHFTQYKQMYFDAANLSLSELFTGYNVKGQNNFCGGAGDTQQTLSFITDYEKDIESLQVQNFTSFPFHENVSVDYPYNPDMQLSPRNKDLRLIPVSLEDDEELNNHETVNIRLYNDEEQWTQKWVRKLKSYVARGIAVNVKLRIDFNQFADYDGRSVLRASCDPNLPRFETVIIGYGEFMSKRVWILRAASGESWGSAGHFYVEVGLNSFCLEQSAFVVETMYIKKRKNWKNEFGESFQSGFSNIQRGDGYWLDIDTTEFDDSNPRYTTSDYVMMGFGSAIAVVVLGFVIFGCVKYFNHKKRLESQKAIKQQRETEQQAIVDQEESKSSTAKQNKVII